MSRGINNFIGIGNLGKDVDVRHTQNGNMVASFSIAVTETWRDKQSGEKREDTEWISCTAFGKLAEICAEYLRRGSKVYVQGKLKTDKYEKDGITRYSTKVIVRDMQMLDSKGSGGDGGGYQNSQPASQPAQQGGPIINDDEWDSEIPF